MSLATDKPQAMPTLENPGDQAGVPLAKVLEGDLSTGKNASAALVAKDAAGNLQYIKVNTNNEIIVDIDSAEVACLTETGKVAGSNVAEQAVMDIVLQNSLEYKELGWIVSNFRQTEYRIVWIDDEGGGGEAETELATILVGPGGYTDSNELECLSFTTGAIGNQVLRVYGLNKDAASDLRATVSIKEVQ